jgi:hypothetical protein
VLATGALLTSGAGIVAAAPAHAATCNVSNWTGLLTAFASGGTAVLCRPVNDADQSNYMQLVVPPDFSADLDLNGWTLKIINVPAGEAGIKVPVGANLSIGDSTLTRLGRLLVNGGGGSTVGGGGGAGIGGGGGIGAINPTQGSDGTAAGTVNITGGNVVATGGAGSNNPVHGAGGGGGGAGIGGGGGGAGDGPHFNTHVNGGNGGILNLTGGDLRAMGGPAGMAGSFGEPGSAGGAGIGGGGGAGTGRGKYASGNGGMGGAIRLVGGTVNSVGGTGDQAGIMDAGGGGAGIGAGGGGPVNPAAARTGGSITVAPGTARVADSGPGTGGDQKSQNGQEPQQVMLTSTPPAYPDLGGTYRVTAISTFGTSGQPIVFSTPATDNACALEVDAETVTFTRTGICTIDANQAGSNGYGYDTAPTATQSFSVLPADHPDGSPSAGSTRPFDRAAPQVPAPLLGARPRVTP